MALSRFLIAPLNTGLQTDVRPWLIPDDAFQVLANAYLYRGRVRKRPGGVLLNNTVADNIAQFYSRLAINIGTTDGAGNFAGNAPGVIFEIGQAFATLGDQMFTVNALGTPANMLISGTATLATFNTTTGAVVINGAAANTDVYFYPAQPVMGFTQPITIAIDNAPTYAFDTQFAYEYNGTNWERLGNALWTGTDKNFFWSMNYRGATQAETYLFTTNFNTVTPDPIRYWDGAAWNNFTPVLDNAGNTLTTALVIISFQQRLLFLNTLENIAAVQTAFPRRIRYSWSGSPVDANAFNAQFNGNAVGSFINLQTTEQIVSARLFKNRLIIFCDASTWELVYTNNPADPFVAQRINEELGVQSTFSTVLFDKAVLGVGNVGIHACNGTNVERIDEKIPQQVFNFQTEDDSSIQVQGIRDYYNEMVYWAYPNAQTTPDYPNIVLMYNYRTGSWATMDDSITAFGYYQAINDLRWEDVNNTWLQLEATWASATFNAQFPAVIAGNQEGFTFVIDNGVAINSYSLQITDINVTNPFQWQLTIINHNLLEGDFIYVNNIVGTAAILNNNIVPVYAVIDENTIAIETAGAVGTYDGEGVVQLVSQIDIITKEFNFFQKEGRNAYIPQVNCNVDATVNGAITIDFYDSTSTLSMTDEGAITGALLGTNVLDTSPYPLQPLEATQTRLWHPVYTQAEGEYIQLRIYLSTPQMTDPLIAFSDFELHALLIYAQPTASRLQ